MSNGLRTDVFAQARVRNGIDLSSRRRRDLPVGGESSRKDTIDRTDDSRLRQTIVSDPKTARIHRRLQLVRMNARKRRNARVRDWLLVKRRREQLIIPRLVDMACAPYISSGRNWLEDPLNLKVSHR